MIAVISVVIAIISWREGVKARRLSAQSATAAAQSAEAAIKAVDIEHGRLHRELTPKLRVEWRAFSGSGHAWNSGVLITNDGPIDYATITVELMPPADGTPEIAEQIQVKRTGQTGGVGQAIPFGSLVRGADAALLIHPRWDTADEHRHGPVRLRVVCTNPDTEPWVVHLETEIPGPSLRPFFIKT